MTMTTCPSAELLQRLLDNGLSPAEDVAVSAHVQGCGTCQEQLERLTGGVSFPNGRPLPPGAVRHAPTVHPGLLSRLLSLSPSRAGGDTPAGTTSFPARMGDGPALLPLPRIPGYEIVAELGRGGMGVVYQARETALGRFVALKMLLAGAQAGGEHLARFRREAEIIASLHHPNIVQIHAVGEYDGCLFFTMEYVEGGSLARHLGGIPENPRAAAVLVQTLAEAVQAAHQLGVIHRDLKPANILLEFNDRRSANSPTQRSQANPPTADRGVLGARPRITDFGLAKRFDPEAAAGTLSGSSPVMGSPSYMAPEQARGQPGAVGPAADVYALGAILYECLTGRPPFRAATPVDTVLQVLHAEPVPPRSLQPTVPRDLETICLHCLRKEPAKRYPSARALAEDLGHFLVGEPVRARPVGPWERAVNQVRRRPALAALAGVGSATVLAVVLLSGWYNLRVTAEIREVKRQRSRADTNLREALKAVDGMLNALQDPRTGGVVEPDEPRRRQLDQAVQFYQSILAEPDNATPEARRLSGLAHYNLGRISFLLGSGAQAVPHLHQAAAVQQALADEFPCDRSYRKELAETSHLLGNVTTDLDHRQEWYHKALELVTALAQENPQDLDAPRMQAVIQNSQYHVFRDLNQRDRGEAALLDALAVGESLVERSPGDLVARIILSHSCTRLGLLAAQERQWDRARSYLRKSLAVLEAHMPKPADDRDFVLALAQTYNILAFVAQQTGQPDERRDWCTRMIQALESSLRPRPRDAQLRLLLAEAHGGRGVALSNLGRYAEAVPDLDRLVELADGRQRVRYRSLRALNRAFAGDHAAACAEARELAGLASEDGPLLYELGCVCCSALNAARKDERLTVTARNQRAEEYARQAVVLLAKAQAAGFFRDANRLRLLREGTDLGPLRDRDDFHLLLRSAASGAP